MNKRSELVNELVKLGYSDDEAKHIVENMVDFVDLEETIMKEDRLAVLVSSVYECAFEEGYKKGRNDYIDIDE